MGKSEWRKAVLEKFPDAVCKLGVFTDSKAAEYVFVDSMQTLKSCSSHTIRSWGDLVHCLLNDCRWTSKSFPKVHTFVVCFDDYRRVPLAKSVEQKKRSKPGGDRLDEFEIGALGDTLTDEFSSALHDRNRWCPQIIRYCAKHWASDCPPTFLKEGQRLIVDGHYLDYGDIDGVAVHPDAPMVITRTNGEFVVDFLAEHEHGLGEGDLSMAFLLDRLVAQNSSVLMYSVDSDMMWYLLRLLETTNKYYNLYWRYAPMLSWCASPNPFPQIREKNKQEWCHMNALRVMIDGALRKLPAELRVTTLAIACFSAGNDYIDPFPRVPPHHFVTAFFNNIEYIGPLCERPLPTTWVLNFENYEKLVHCAVQNTGKKGFSAEEDVSKELKCQPAELKCRKLHTAFFVDMLNHVGEDFYKELNLSSYGYCRLDKTKPPARGNLGRAHLSSEIDSWTLQEQGQFPPIALRGKAVVVSETRTREKEEDFAERPISDALYAQQVFIYPEADVE